MLTEDRPMPVIPPELQAKQLHAGNKGYKGPQPYVEMPYDPPTDSVVESTEEYWTRVDTEALARANTLRDRANTPADDVLPNDPKARKGIPVGAVLDYFDAAVVEIAKALKDGNDQHNPGEPLHWARGKSADHAHCIIRHYLQRGKLAVSPTGAVIRHSTHLAIRALMLLQEELEANGAPLSRGSRK